MWGQQMKYTCAILGALILSACQTAEYSKSPRLETSYQAIESQKSPSLEASYHATELKKPASLGTGPYVLLIQVMLKTAKMADTVMYPFPSFKKCEDTKYFMVSFYQKNGHFVTLAECRGKLSA